jgi:acyl carrier protein
MPVMPRDRIRSELLRILEDMTSDWDLDRDAGFSEATRLVADLSFESVEVVQLMVAIEEHFALQRLASSRLLMQDGRYVTDVSVGRIVDFLDEELNPR